MTGEERSQIESKAERALRRGELAEAVGMFESLVAAHPEDQALGLRLAQLRESLQPMELQNPKSRGEPAKLLQQALTPEQDGERLFAEGDYVGAAAAYRRALKDRPDSELLKERLVEIFQLAQSVTPGPSRGHGDAPTKPRAANATSSSAGGERAAASGRPEDVLKSLLARIESRRRAS